MPTVLLKTLSFEDSVTVHVEPQGLPECQPVLAAAFRGQEQNLAEFGTRHDCRWVYLRAR
jgi:hypothetical protein